MRSSLRALAARTFVVVAALAGASAGPSGALAGGNRATLRVLYAASVTDRARSAMPPASWTRFIASYAGPTGAVLGDGSAPDTSGCRKAGGDLLIVAPFDLRDDLPGLVNASGRFAGRSQLVILNCNAGTVLFAGKIRFDGEPVTPGTGSSPDIVESAWARAVPAALARIRVGVARIVRVRRLAGGGGVAHLALAFGSLRPNDVIEDDVRANRSPRRAPVALIVTHDSRATADAVFTAPPPDADDPAVGDFVELGAPPRLPQPEASEGPRTFTCRPRPAVRP